MATNLSIKNVPEKVVRRLRARANANRRSLQGELLSIIESSVSREHVLSPREALARLRRRGLRTPSEAAKMIRADRNGR
jgi:plasmid stability protein